MEFYPIPSMDNKFGISKEGKVKNFITDRIISSYIGIDCYEHIVLCYKGKRYRKRVHRLMAEVFLHNAKCIDHIDNNKSNNLLSNLRPISQRDNIIKGVEYAKNFNKGAKLFKPMKVIAIDKVTKEIHQFDSLRRCEKFTGVDRHRIKTFLRNERPNYTNYEFYLD